MTWTFSNKLVLGLGCLATALSVIAQSWDAMPFVGFSLLCLYLSRNDR